MKRSIWPRALSQSMVDGSHSNRYWLISLHDQKVVLKMVVALYSDISTPSMVKH